MDPPAHPPVVNPENSPTSRARGTLSEEASELLEGVHWLRICFVDLFGALRSVQIPKARFEEVLVKGALFDGSALEGQIRLLEADRILRPDLSTLARATDGSARVLATVETESGEPWPLDPRTALIQICEDLSDISGRWRGSAELEWYLFDQNLEPLDKAGYFSDHSGLGSFILRHVAEELDSLGIDVVSAHHEAGPGQYEVDLGAMEPVRIADAITHAKALVMDAAQNEGAKATFVARPLANQPGSGLHMHQHLEGLGLATSETPTPGNLAEEAKWAIGGLLHHARGLCALAAPNVSSYRRLHSGPEAPGAVVWAHTNRAALVRIGHTDTGQPSLEYRGADPSANPYLLVAGLLASLNDGIASRLSPGRPLEEEPTGFDPAAMEAAPRDLPRSLDAAIDALLEDEVLMDTFDSRLLGRLIDGQRAQADAAGANVTRADLLSSLEN